MNTIENLQAKAQEFMSQLNGYSLRDANTILTLAQGQINQFCYVQYPEDRQQEHQSSEVS